MYMYKCICSANVHLYRNRYTNTTQLHACVRQTGEIREKEGAHTGRASLTLSCSLHRNERSLFAHHRSNQVTYRFLKSTHYFISYEITCVFNQIEEATFPNTFNLISYIVFNIVAFILKCSLFLLS